ncbi:hypothetical protein B0J18DRAFT_414941 [Chaetomium sp. MPI-SDFR-AT-0129]|nr:hypothetical protein B0J18DRAFT_414941 [Chaetomium sp. MPI-SDFR-AT-0129]
MSGSGSASVSASVSAGASGSGSVEGWRRGSITGITGAPAGYRERAGSGTMGSGVHGFDGGRHKDEVENRSGDGDVGTGTTDGSEHAGKRPASGTAAAAALVTPIRDQEHETKEAQGPRPLSMLPNSTQGASREVSSQGETTTHTKDEPLDEETTLWTEGHGPGLAMPGKTGLTVDVTRVPAFEAALRIVEHVRGLDNGRGC